MDYKYDNAGIELLLAHMNIEDIIDVVEHLYHTTEEEKEAGASFAEGLSQEEMDENEETVDDLWGEVTGGSQGTQQRNSGGRVRYGTVADLLSFVNQISNMQPEVLQHLPEEMGVLLNKVRLQDIG